MDQTNGSPQAPCCSNDSGRQQQPKTDGGDKSTRAFQEAEHHMEQTFALPEAEGGQTIEQILDEYEEELEQLCEEILRECEEEVEETIEQIVAECEDEVRQRIEEIFGQLGDGLEQHLEQNKAPDVCRNLNNSATKQHDNPQGPSLANDPSRSPRTFIEVEQRMAQIFADTDDDLDRRMEQMFGPE